VSRPDLQVIRLLLEFSYGPVQVGCEAFHASVRAGRTLQQIWPTYVPHKNEISGQHTDGLRTALEIGNKKSQMLRGVTGGVRGPHPNLAERNVRSISQRLRMFESITTVSPLLRSLGGQVQLRTSSHGERLRTRHEIRVDVRLRHVGDSDPLRAGGAQVVGDVEVGVDHRSFARALTRDEVACLRQIIVVEAFE